MFDDTGWYFLLFLLSLSGLATHLAVCRLSQKAMQGVIIRSQFLLRKVDTSNMTRFRHLALEAFKITGIHDDL